MNTNISIEERVKKSDITNTQLRLILSNSVIIKNKIKNNNDEKLANNIQNEIKYLLIKVIYQAGRDSKVKKFIEDFKMVDKIKQIGDSAKKFNEFYRYLEEIVAYSKYYEDENKKQR